MPLSAAESPRGVLGRARPFAKRPPGSNSYGKVVLKKKKTHNLSHHTPTNVTLPPLESESCLHDPIVEKSQQSSAVCTPLIAGTLATVYPSAFDSQCDTEPGEEIQ